MLIFSHGFGGCAKQSKFLTEALAAHGYWVFAPNHKDARCRHGQSGGDGRPQEPFGNPLSWSDKTFADRRDDIRAIQQALATSPEFVGRVDLTRLGYVGHSLGGYTVVGLAGGWPSWRTPGARAVLALSPYTQPYLVHKTLGGLSAPVMYQGGTLDVGITPSLGRAGGVYDVSPAPKYFVELEGAGHLAWTDLRAAAHGAINAYAIAFLDHYVLGAAAAPTLTQALSRVSELRYDSELGHGGTPARRGTSAMPNGAKSPRSRLLEVGALNPFAPFVPSGDVHLPDIQLRGADCLAVDVQQERVAPCRRQLEEVELEWQVDGDRVDSRLRSGQRDVAAGTADLLAGRVGNGNLHAVGHARLVGGKVDSRGKREPRDVHRDRVRLDLIQDTDE